MKMSVSKCLQEINLSDKNVSIKMSAGDKLSDKNVSIKMTTAFLYLFPLKHFYVTVHSSSSCCKAL